MVQFHSKLQAAASKAVRGEVGLEDDCCIVLNLDKRKVMELHWITKEWTTNRILILEAIIMNLVQLLHNE